MRGQIVWIWGRKEVKIKAWKKGGWIIWMRKSRSFRLESIKFKGSSWWWALIRWHWVWIWAWHVITSVWKRPIAFEMKTSRGTKKIYLAVLNSTNWSMKITS